MIKIRVNKILKTENVKTLTQQKESLEAFDVVIIFLISHMATFICLQYYFCNQKAPMYY